ncbi:PLDc N-terminal domain-containing protein [Bacillus alkalicellulosilyticus]|uniref:PLDc N-terminal domain-containing protein n=1 Tax=Alkalihalobacterium alkalicellulosilyticum TaxID=1912214 RepID=UPI0009971ACA|nr:PLDc N-terminal domain-containing protein [Bacillus alkalicellulosilyticus]
MDVVVVFGIFIIFGIGLFVLNIVTSIWAYRDSIANGNSKEFALLVLLGTLFFPVVGLIVYLIIRKT